MRNLFLLLGIFTSYFCSAQNEFQPGFILNNNGEKLNCFIKNLDWLNTPTSIELKESLDGIPKNADINEIKEFKIENGAHYIRVKTEIETSKADITELDYDRKPNLVEQTVFLKSEVSGTANLYSYTTFEKTLFFFSNLDSKIELLVYKEYLNQDKQLAKNLMYQQQLLNNLLCDDISKVDIKYLKYKKHILVKFFEKYNQCKDPDYIQKSKAKPKQEFNLSLRAGINFGKIEMETLDPSTINTNYEGNIRIGLEIEYILPFNNGKWGVVLEPNYHEFKTNKGDITSPHVVAFTINSTLVQIPVAIRYYSYLNNKSRLYYGAGTSFNYLLNNSKVDIANKYTSVSRELDKGRTAQNFVFSVGYSYNKRINVELNYNTSFSFTSSTGGGANGHKVKYNAIGIILGYTIF